MGETKPMDGKLTNIDRGGRHTTKNACPVSLRFTFLFSVFQCEKKKNKSCSTGVGIRNVKSCLSRICIKYYTSTHPHTHVPKQAQEHGQVAKAYYLFRYFSTSFLPLKDGEGERGEDVMNFPSRDGAWINSIVMAQMMPP